MFFREKLAEIYESSGELLADLGSDQTSCHNPYNGGYYPVGLDFRMSNSLMTTDPAAFGHKVRQRYSTNVGIGSCFKIKIINS